MLIFNKKILSDGTFDKYKCRRLVFRGDRWKNTDNFPWYSNSMENDALTMLLSVTATKDLGIYSCDVKQHFCMANFLSELNSEFEFHMAYLMECCLVNSIFSNVSMTIRSLISASKNSIKIPIWNWLQTSCVLSVCSCSRHKWRKSFLMGCYWWFRYRSPLWIPSQAGSIGALLYDHLERPSRSLCRLTLYPW